MAPTEDFPAYNRLADALIERATKDQVADVARLLALNIGWCQQRYGAVTLHRHTGTPGAKRRARSLNHGD